MTNRKIAKILASIVFILTIAILIVFVKAAMSPPEPIPAPPIGQNLPADFATADFAFNERIQKTFPIGSSASDLATRLDQEGFRHDAVGDDGNYATFQRPYGFCNLIWAVSWHADPQGRITSVQGDYSGKCL
ncbi:hypothetical protein [Methylorubrum sp. SB2]|uniref:hypothetical protein n=1 Tax=Methylorubrum subtropicum TaxID=3138812 RepID=UPI00313AC9ED